MATAFVNGRVFVGDGRILEHATVLVEGDRIVKVGKGKTSVPRCVKPHHLNSVRMAREAGIMVAAGTDAGTPFNEHGQKLGEMVLLASQGYSPSDALKAGTSIGAKVLGGEKDFGTVEEGKVVKNEF
jgi:imidazolonepropionase-like amidohydrolase